MKEAAYERIAVCTLCGQQFKVKCKTSRPRRCPECSAAIAGRRYKGADSVRKKRKVSNLDTLAREARECGLSYGKYVGLKKAGFKIKPMKQAALARREEGWIEELYAIVAAGRRRAKEKTR